METAHDGIKLRNPHRLGWTSFTAALFWWVLLLVPAGCSAPTRPYSRISDPIVIGESDNVYESNPGLDSMPAALRSYPWEFWSLGRDLSGNELPASIVSGDDLFAAGNRQAALNVYLGASKLQLLPNQRKALTIRVASTQLALDRTGDALTTLTRFFTDSGQSPDQVDPYFSTIFGFAFFRKGDIDQSLAWFLKVMKNLQAPPSMASLSEVGVRWILRSLPEERLHAVESTWAGDEHLGAYLGQERSRRARGGQIETPDRTSQVSVDQFHDAPPAPLRETVKEAVNIGILLPLTGPYAGLGESIKGGIDLAFEAQGGQIGFKLIYKDTGSDPVAARESFNDIVQNDAAQIVLGPLLSDAALAVAEEAQRVGTVPVITFSKGSTLRIGGGVFRLGATV